MALGAALALGIDGVEGQGAFTAAGKPRQHHQLVPGDGNVDVLQVVLPCALDENFSLHGMPHFCNILLQISVVKTIFNVNSQRNTDSHAGVRTGSE